MTEVCCTACKYQIQNSHWSVMTSRHYVQGAEKGHIPGFVKGTGILAGFNLIDGDLLRNILVCAIYILYKIEKG